MIDCFELEKNKGRRPDGWKSINDDADVAAAGVENSEIILMCYDCDEDVCGSAGGDDGYDGGTGGSELAVDVMFENGFAVDGVERNDDARCHYEANREIDRAI